MLLAGNLVPHVIPLIRSNRVLNILTRLRGLHNHPVAHVHHHVPRTAINPLRLIFREP